MANDHTESDESSGALPSIPGMIRFNFDPTWKLIQRFCRDRLNDEYLYTCTRLLTALACKRPSPLKNGTPGAWAAGVVRAIGSVNFLHDQSQTPYVTTGEIDKAFGVSPATGSARSKKIRDMFKMSPLDSKWTVPGKMADNPMAYMISVGGFIMDARSAPVEIQRKAVEKGLIPPLPPGTAKFVDTQPPAQAMPAKVMLYTFEVAITSGMITKAFAKKNRVISRTIQIRGDQTLADLHECIFDAFDRFDFHLYEFQLGKGPRDFDAPRYRPKMALENLFEEDKRVGAAEEKNIGSLGLKVGRSFGYWFDFGDDWMHQIDVVSIDNEVPTDKYPKVVKRIGESPPQYLNEADED